MTKALKAAKELQDNWIKRGIGTANVHFGLVVESGRYSNCYTQACFARCGDEPSPAYGTCWTGSWNDQGAEADFEKDPAIYFVDRSANNQYGPADYKIRWLDFLLNKSMWSHIFVTKDPEEIIKQGCIYDLSAVPMRHVIHAANLVRYTTEHADIPKRWDVFRKYFDPDLSMYLPHYFTLNKDEIIESRTGMGHSIIDPTGITRGRLANIIRKRIINPDGQKMASVFPYRYRGLSSVFDNPAKEKAKPNSDKVVTLGGGRETSKTDGFGFVRKFYLVNIDDDAENFLKFNLPDGEELLPNALVGMKDAKKKRAPRKPKEAFDEENQ